MKKTVKSVNMTAQTDTTLELLKKINSKIDLLSLISVDNRDTEKTMKELLNYAHTCLDRCGNVKGTGLARKAIEACIQRLS